MQVYLITGDGERGRAIQSLLAENGILSTVVPAVDPAAIAPSVVCHLAAGADNSTLTVLAAAAAADHIVIAVAAPAAVPPSLPGVYLLPADVHDDILVSLTACFLRSRDREAHYGWIADELMKVNHALREETQQLKAARDELDRKSRKITEELVLANIIQNSLLPRHFPNSLPLNFAHKYIPHEYIGGDFFEVMPVADHQLGILIADVSGHGVASALITAMLKTLFSHAARECLSPAEVLKRLNLEFTQVMRTEHYITAFYAIIDTDRFVMRYSNAGHPRQIIMRPGENPAYIGANGFLLGLFEDTAYEECSLSLAPGDRLILYTDGIIECPDREGRQFGQDNLLAAISRHAGEDIETLSKNIIVDLISHLAESRFPDDITLLLCEVIPLL